LDYGKGNVNLGFVGVSEVFSSLYDLAQFKMFTVLILRAPFFSR
jgi:hypothetical protein